MANNHSQTSMSWLTTYNLARLSNNTLAVTAGYSCLSAQDLFFLFFTDTVFYPTKCLSPPSSTPQSDSPVFHHFPNIATSMRARNELLMATGDRNLRACNMEGSVHTDVSRPSRDMLREGDFARVLPS